MRALHSSVDPSLSLPLLASAPHRLLFFSGACAVLCSMGWWTLQLAATRFGWTSWPQPPMPPGWAHATLTQYGMLPLFMFGFLLTVFPRWLNQPAVPPKRYIPVAGGILAGYLLAHVGLFGSLWLLRCGFLLMLAGYLIGIAMLGSVLRASTARQSHAWSCWVALLAGAMGLALFTAYLFGGPAAGVQWSIRLGTFGFLLPVYFTVCHRMIPFFSGNVIEGYVVRRPGWSLPVVWALLAARLLIDMGHAQGWLAIVDIPLMLVFAWHALAWQPWLAKRPGLLAVLHWSFAWLPVAFALYAIQDVALSLAGVSVLGRAPLHALTVGFFGSMLVAMVTRVTQGHSGRPLQFGAVAWVCFALLQIVVLLRIRAELGGDTYLWLVISAAGWMLAFAPWAVRSAWIYLTPRRDGQPG